VSGEIPSTDTNKRLERRGAAASPGIGIGPAYVVDRRRVQVPHQKIEKSETEAEVTRFRTALRETHDQIEGVKSRLGHGEHRQILKAQQLMLRDPDLIQRTERLIQDESLNAEWAVARVSDQIQERFDAIEDEYLAARQFDVAFLTERILRTLLGTNPDEIHPPEGAVVIAHDLSPADTAQLHEHNVAAIVTDEGAPTSHAAITARSLEIPAIVGVDDIVEQLESGVIVAVDAVHGRVIINPNEEDLAKLAEETRRYEEFEDRILKERALPAVTQDGHRIRLRSNIAMPSELESSLSHRAEGIGLYRTEYLFLGRDTAPTEEEHYQVAKHALAQSAPFPVLIRTFDLGADKESKVFRAAHVEANPALGMRGTRLALKYRDEFRIQLRGLLRAAVHGPLRIMLPLISGLEEFHEALAIIDEAKEQLNDEGIAHSDDVPIGVMIELPSAALVSDVLADHVDFMSIGTNDLIQYTLAIDRENDEVNYLYKPLHPAIVRLIRTVCEAGKRSGVPVSVCGEMAADPMFTWVLVGMGVEELSMQSVSIPLIKQLLRLSSLTEMEELANSVLQAATADEAVRVVHDRMLDRFPEHMQHRAGVDEDELPEVEESS
jgi:phosphotransferase system enzyme I (PtsI)